MKVIDLNVSSDFTEEIQNIQFPRMLIRGTKQIQDYFAYSLGIQVHPVMKGYWRPETMNYRCQVHLVCENQADQAMLKLHVTPDTLINSVIYHSVNDALPETFVLGHELTVIDKIYPTQSTQHETSIAGQSGQAD